MKCLLFAVIAGVLSLPTFAQVYDAWAEVTPVPEPGAMGIAAMLLGVFGLARRVRRRVVI